MGVDIFAHALAREIASLFTRMSSSTFYCLVASFTNFKI
jgi:hypothetical protein